MARKAKTGSGVFAAAPGFHISDKDAQIIGTAVEGLQKRLKRAVLSSDMVEAARDPVSPLHRFIWKLDDATAAYKWRLDRATYLLQAVTVTFPDREGVPPVRAFIPIDPSVGKSSGFVATSTASAEVIRRQVDRARADARNIVESYEAWVSFSEFTPEAKDFVRAAQRLVRGT